MQTWWMLMARGGLGILLGLKKEVGDEEALTLRGSMSTRSTLVTPVPWIIEKAGSLTSSTAPVMSAECAA